MKKAFILFMVFVFSLASYAKVPENKLNALPSGVFKKSRNGNIVQYDKNGKKVHTYKIKNGRITGIK